MVHAVLHVSLLSGCCCRAKRVQKSNHKKLREQKKCMADQAQIIQIEPGNTDREMIAECPNIRGDKKSEGEKGRQWAFNWLTNCLASILLNNRGGLCDKN